MEACNLGIWYCNSLGGTLGQGHQAGCCGHFIEMNPQGICEKGRALDLWTLCAMHGSRLSVSSGVLRGRSRSLIGLVACGFRSSGALSAVVYLGKALHGCENISFERHVSFIYRLAYEMQAMLAYCRVAPDEHHLVKWKRSFAFAGRFRRESFGWRTAGSLLLSWRTAGSLLM